MKNHKHSPQNAVTLDRLLTIRETCYRLTLSRTTVYRLAQAGLLPIVRLTPSRAAFRERDVIAFIESRMGRTPDLVHDGSQGDATDRQRG